MEDKFSMDGDGGFEMIQVHYIYCALYFCCISYYINYTLGHQALDPRAWGPVL